MSDRSQTGEMLLDFWYPALRSAHLKRKQMRRQVLLNVALVVGRDNHGKVFAMEDHCPHRGMPLSYGSFDGERLECCYHGWQFDCAGQCQYIPALLPDSPLKIDRIRTKTYLCAEADGHVWVYMPSEIAESTAPTDIPRLPVFSTRYRQLAMTRKLACGIDHGIIGLMDPAHGPFVHQSFWWRSRKSIHAKAKLFEPIPNGFRMSAHMPSSNSSVYKLFNVYKQPVTTTIDFILPNVRFEQVRCGDYWFSSRTTVTPVSNTESRLDFVAAWNVLRGVPFITSLAGLFAHLFIGQDQRIMEKQSLGLKENPRLMLIDDADVPAKWYYKLKSAYLEVQKSGGTLDHPLKSPVTLRWRS